MSDGATDPPRPRVSSGVLAFVGEGFAVAGLCCAQISSPVYETVLAVAFALTLVADLFAVAVFLRGGRLRGWALLITLPSLYVGWSWFKVGH